ncbi:MAG: hypothetical protein FWF77_07365 [Defluviitaleaceae bacterium]|nr:hypothetical protein [Defluviitaleaceae bacterium]
MAEIVLQTRALPEPLLRLISSDNVKIQADTNGEIRLIPVKESMESVNNCPFLGMYTDGKLTVDGYLERKRRDKELEL